ncbi:MAG TPA: HipA domain-containing protein [Chthoniobacterales bacterium]
MPQPERYPTVQLKPDWVRSDETMGTKDKAWFLLPDTNEQWLFKYARVNEGVSTGEHWAEKIAAEIAELIGIPHASVELAEFDGRPGSLSRRFPELSQPAIELIHGNDLLPGFVLGYDREKRFRQTNHTLVNILAAVSRAIPDETQRSAAISTLTGYVIFDALILNTDRHHENWALLRNNRPSGAGYSVAPSFDHASSLGRELRPEKLDQWANEMWRAEWYANRAPGAIFLREDQAHGANPLRLAEFALRLRPRRVAPWLERLRGLNIARFSEIIERVPEACMPEQSRRFCLSLLSHTLQHLQNLK